MMPQGEREFTADLRFSEVPACARKQVHVFQKHPEALLLTVAEHACHCSSSPVSVDSSGGVGFSGSASPVTLESACPVHLLLRR